MQAARPEQVGKCGEPACGPWHRGLVILASLLSYRNFVRFRCARAAGTCASQMSMVAVG